MKWWKLVRRLIIAAQKGVGIAPDGKPILSTDLHEATFEKV